MFQREEAWYGALVDRVPTELRPDRATLRPQSLAAQFFRRGEGSVVPTNRDGAAADGAAVEKAARDQVVFREVNERIAELTGLLDETGFNMFICECSNPGCAESLEITAGEYEAVRADGARFVIVNGHQTPEVARVVDGNGRFIVVERTGQAAEIARANTAPRL
jgi:hypothetical protein